MNNTATKTLCFCDTPGKDDGEVICWIHHNCEEGQCTHMESSDE